MFYGLTCGITRKQSRVDLELLRDRALAVLERVRADTKYRLRSKVGEIEAQVAIDALAEAEAALRGCGKWFLARRWLLLQMKYLR
jgi:hypothetical protein